MMEVKTCVISKVCSKFIEGVFRVKLTFGADFPQAPPKGLMMTKIFHPNVRQSLALSCKVFLFFSSQVSKAGEICVNTLKKDWSPELGIKHVLMVC